VASTSNAASLVVKVRRRSAPRWYCQHPAYRLRARTALRADTANLIAVEVDWLARQSGPRRVR
jgi:hypothetical protein